MLGWRRVLIPERMNSSVSGTGVGVGKSRFFMELAFVCWLFV